MDSGESVRDLIGRFTGALDRSAVPYMITGSLASSFHGEPRSTQDVDIVIDPERRSLGMLLDQFPLDTYYVSRDAAISAFQLRGQFNVIDLATGWKVDFIIRKDREFSRLEFDRRVREKLFDVGVYIAAPEDVILVKLEWAKSSDSERQIRDVAGILRLRGNEIDRVHVETWVERLGLQDQWESAKQMVTGH